MSAKTSLNLAGVVFLLTVVCLMDAHRYSCMPQSRSSFGSQWTALRKVGDGWLHVLREMANCVSKLVANVLQSHSVGNAKKRQRRPRVHFVRNVFFALSRGQRTPRMKYTLHDMELKGGMASFNLLKSC
eukprot:1159117-Pelagomonas_calceolata.AAC.6